MSACLVVQVILLLLACPTARAGDPALRWRTLDGPGFRLHYFLGEERLALRTRELTISLMKTLEDYFGWQPGEVMDLVVVDDQDSANGLTYTFPHNEVVLYAFPPELDEQLSCTDDWLKMLLVHELAHVFQLDRATGLVKVINTVVGKSYLPNHAWPLWFIEGLAVNIETMFTTGGRLRSPRFEMILRMAALEGTFLDLPGLSGNPLVLPRGSSSYLYGGFFLGWLIENHGPAWLPAMVDDYSDRLIPFSFNIMFRRHLGRDLVTLYREWTTWVFDRAQALVRERRGPDGVLEGRHLAFGGEHPPSPRFTGDGAILHAYTDGHSQPVLRRLVEDQEPEELARCYGGCGEAQEDGRGRIWYLSNRFFETVYYFQELHALDPASGRSTQLTSGLRCRSFSLHPDGGGVCAAAGIGSTSLVRLGAEGEVLETIEAREQGSPDVLGQPRLSPDGKTLFFVVREGDRSVIKMLPEHGRTPITLTREAIAQDPAPSPDNRWLVYSAAEDGVFDIFALDLTGACPRRRLTRVLGGAFAPTVSPDGTRVVYASYHSDGYHLFQLDFSPDCVPQEASGLPETPGDKVPVEAPAGDLPTVSAPEPVARPYLPYRYIRPYTWNPQVVVEGTSLTSIGLDLTGRDPAGLQDLYVSAYRYPQSEETSGSIQWGVNLFPVQLSFGGAVFQNVMAAIQGDQALTWDEMEYLLSANLSAPFPGVEKSLRWTASYSMDLFSGSIREDYEIDPGAREPYMPTEGRLAYITLSMAFDNSERYTWSVARERGLQASMSMRWASGMLGSQWAQQRVRGNLTWYQPLWWRHHTLAVNWQGGVAAGQRPFKPSFSLGGYPTQDVIRDLIDNTGISGSYLRGFISSAFSGDQYQYMSLDYTLPLYRIRKGVQTWPIFFEDLWAELFTNAGYAANSFSPLDGGVGLGLEVKMSVVFAFSRSFTFTTGFAKGFGEGGAMGMYFLVGP